MALLLGYLLSALSAHAGVTLTVNGGSLIAVNAGDPITFTWTATADLQRVERGWGGNPGTALPLSGSETIRALNPGVVTGYGYTVIGYDSAGVRQQAGVQVNVSPAVTPLAYTPIVWVPSLPNFVI